jgi:hypothetical protein
MALSPDQIKILLSLPDKQARGRKPKGYVDTSVRDYQTWFKLNHKMYEEGAPDDKPQCANPNCPDTRNKQMISDVNGINMCRICFLGGYMLVNPDQTQLIDE